MTDSVLFQSVADGAPGLTFTAPRRNKAEAAEYFKGLTDQLEMCHYTVDYYLSDGDQVVAVGST
ncbi:MAG: nuclear transport factor 2 family protein, partial [Alphaproteobacteria bacterium]